MRPKKRTFKSDNSAFTQVSFLESMLHLIEEGSHSSFEEFEYLYENYLKDEANDQQIFNRLLSNGCTLLFSACKEGKVEFVQFMLDKQWNPFQKCLVKGTKESVLDIAAKWNYVEVVELLLAKVNFPESYLMTAYKLAENYTIRRLIKSKLKDNGKNRFFVFC